MSSLVKRRLSRNRDARILDDLRQTDRLEDGIALGQTDLGSYEGQSAGGQDGEGFSDGSGGERSQGVEMVLALGGEDTQSTTHATNEE